MKVERRKYHADDRWHFEPRAIFLDTALESLETLARFRDSYMETILIDGKPAAIIGLVLQWRGCATAWSVTSDELKKAPKEFHALVLEMLEEYSRIFKIWRIQFNVVANYREGVRWAEGLGFVNEGTMKKFDPMGRDYYRFARIFNV